MTRITNNKKLITVAVKKHLLVDNWQEIDTLMVHADKYQLPAKLRLKGWLGVAEYRFKKDKLAEAIEAYNRARILDPANENILEKLFGTLDRIFERFKVEFSRQDLRKLEEPIEKIINYYKVNEKAKALPIEYGQLLLQKIRFQIYDAPWRLETPATYAVQQIYDALYTGMTIEEVRAEFARLMAPIFREIIDKEDSEEDKPKKKKTPKTTKKKKK